MTEVIVSSGQTASGIVLQPGDDLIVLSGGAATGSFVEPGASLIVLSGGQIRGTTVGLDGGSIQLDGGIALATTFSGSGSFQLSSGSTATQTSLGSGAVMTVGFDAVASGTSVGAFALMSDSEGTTFGTQVAAGGLEYDTFAAAAYGTVIAAGGEQYVDGNAIALDSVVTSGGFLVVSGGGVASNSHVESGGKLIVLSGGYAAATTTDAGGSVQSGGIVELQGKAVILAATGLVTGLMIAGTSAFVLSGGILNEAVVSEGGLNVSLDGQTTEAFIVGGGTETVQSGGLASNTYLAWDPVPAGGVSEAGTMSVLSGGSAVGTYLGSPASGVQPLGHAELDVANGASVALTVVNSGGLLVLSSGAQPTATIVGSGGQIDLQGLAYAPNGSAVLEPFTDVLTVSENGQQVALSLAGHYNNLYFHLASDENGGSLVTANGVPCYRSGTNIRTPIGEATVENLSVGEKVLNSSGEARNIRWIGRRSYQARFVSGRPDLIPVLFRAGSLGHGLPKRDLQVSPLHAMYIDGALIPAAALVNGSSVLQAADDKPVHYFHIELDTHDLIFAEGALSETYLDDDSHDMFANGSDYQSRSPRQFPAAPCAPRITDGPLLASIRRRMSAPPQRTRPSNFNGLIDDVTRDNVTGWAIDLDTPLLRQRLRVVVDGVTAGVVVANRFRGDLEEAGIGDGAHSFVFRFPGGLQPGRRHSIEVVRAECGTSLTRSPHKFHAPPANERPLAVVPLQGRLDSATREGVSGWAKEEAEESTALQIIVDGEARAFTLANRFREDVAAANGDGWCGFELWFPGGLAASSRHVVEVRRASDGMSLPGSPMVIEASGGLDEQMRLSIRATLAALASADERESAIVYLYEEAERLRQLQADTDAERAKRLAWASLRYQVGGATMTGLRLRALVVDPRYPILSRDAGSAALLSHIRALQWLGYDVSFVAADELLSDSQTLRSEGVHCWRGPTYTSVEDVLRRQGGHLDLVYLHRVDMASAYSVLVRRTNPRAKLVYSLADLHHLRLERQAAVEDRLELLHESHRAKLAELTAALTADVVLTHSSKEQEILKGEVPAANIHVVPWVFKPSSSRAKLASRSGVVFVGNFAHAPNVDAAHFLIHDIMPLVWQHDPSMQCTLVGAGMQPSIKELAGPLTCVAGEVDDLQKVWRRTLLSVAPLRFGAGLKGKVIESMAAGVPCVMTAIAAEGLPLGPALQALTADDAQGLASRILRLQTDRVLHSDTSKAGLELVKANFNNHSVLHAMANALGRPCPVPTKGNMPQSFKTAIQPSISRFSRSPSVSAKSFAPQHYS